MRNIGKIFIIAAIFVCATNAAMAQDYGKLLQKATYHRLWYFEFWGTKSPMEDNQNVEVYENAVIMKSPELNNVSFFYVYKGEANGGGRLYRLQRNGTEEDGYVVYKNGVIFSPDGSITFTKGAQQPIAQPSNNNYNNGGYNNNYQNNSNNQGSTYTVNCYRCGGDGRCRGYGSTTAFMNMHCAGTGKCSTCYGKGYTINHYTGNNMTCGTCNGTGKCKQCGGTGTCQKCGGRGK